MKNLTLLLVFLCSFASINAQKYTETVYLKNGSMIHGIVIEQIPNESLKLQTQDGSIYVYPINDVAKITKLMPTSSMQSSSYQLESGYRGFVDLGYSFGVGDYATDRLEFSTSHGYQFNPYFYLGVGAAVNYYHDADVASIPLFVNPRVDIPTNSVISPFVDLKVGYTVSDNVEGFYLAPSIGARFNLQNNMGVNFSLGYTLQKTDGYYYYTDYYGNYGYDYLGKVNHGAITLKLGFDF